MNDMTVEGIYPAPETLENGFDTLQGQNCAVSKMNFSINF